jgi:hypothetical protein
LPGIEGNEPNGIAPPRGVVSISNLRGTLSLIAPIETVASAAAIRLIWGNTTTAECGPGETSTPLIRTWPVDTYASLRSRPRLTLLVSSGIPYCLAASTTMPRTSLGIWLSCVSGRRHPPWMSSRPFSAEIRTGRKAAQIDVSSADMRLLTAPAASTPGRRVRTPSIRRALPLLADGVPGTWKLTIGPTPPRPTPRTPMVIPPGGGRNRSAS